MADGLVPVVDEGLGNSSYLVDLGDGRALAVDPSRDQAPTAVMCGHGERVMSAASLIERAGRGPTSVLLGGPDDWARAHDRALDADR